MFLASVILFNVFSASYTSFLSVVKTAQPFSNIQELEKTDFKIGAPPGSTYKINFEVKSTIKWLLLTSTSLQPLERPASTKLVTERWETATNSEAFRKMKEENYAFMQASQAIYKELGNPRSRQL